MNSSMQSPPHLQGYYAGFVSRLLAIILDFLFIIFSLLAMSWFVTMVTTFLKTSGSIGFSLINIGYFQSFVEFLSSPVLIGIFANLFIVGYFTFFITFISHTPGKAILGLRVVPIEGGKMSFRRSILRFFAYIPTILSFGIGFIWIIIDDQRQAWHDSIARTYVVYTWRAKPDEYFLRGTMNEFLDQNQGK